MIFLIKKLVTSKTARRAAKKLAKRVAREVKVTRKGANITVSVAGYSASTDAVIKASRDRAMSHGTMHPEFPF